MGTLYLMSALIKKLDNLVYIIKRASRHTKQLSLKLFHHHFFYFVLFDSTYNILWFILCLLWPYFRFYNFSNYYLLIIISTTILFSLSFVVLYEMHNQTDQP